MWKEALMHNKSLLTDKTKYHSSIVTLLLADRKRLLKRGSGRIWSKLDGRTS